MERDFLGRGWQFPVETDESGDVELSDGEDDIEESIRIILGTSKGERVMRPAFGCGIHDHVFATVDASTLNLIQTTVEEDLRKWEPRITVENVEATTEELQNGKLMIHVDYRVRTSNNEHNLVYPFYLEEG